jgi:putative hemin transport protein
MCSTFQDIRKSFASLRVEKKHRHREIASFLNVTELELIDAHVGVTKLESIKSSPNVARAIRLKPSWSSIIHDVQGFGEVMSLTSNTHVVHESLAFYKHASSSDDIGMVLSDELAIRLMLSRLEYGYLFEECKSTVLQRSIQFFSEFGVPLHKIFLLPHSHHWYFDDFSKKWSDSNQQPGVIVQEKSERDQILSSGAAVTMIEERDRNQFELIDFDGVQFLLSSIVQAKLPLIITVQNDGVDQSHDGVLDEIKERNDWLHLSNQQFNCHLQLTQLVRVYINHQVSPSSIEMFDDKGFLLAFIALSVKATLAEREIWEDKLEQLREKVGLREMSVLE